MNNVAHPRPYPEQVGEKRKQVEEWISTDGFSRTLCGAGALWLHGPAIRSEWRKDLMGLLEPSKDHPSQAKRGRLT